MSDEAWKVNDAFFRNLTEGQKKEVATEGANFILDMIGATCDACGKRASEHEGPDRKCLFEHTSFTRRKPA